jgi:hypothetical protein
MKGSSRIAVVWSDERHLLHNSSDGVIRDVTLQTPIALHSSTPEEMDTGMADENGTLQLTDNDIAFLLTVLRNAISPLTTQQLIDALRQRSGR